MARKDLRMKAIWILATAFLVPVASADQIYTYGFLTLPSGWTAQSPWTFSPSGAQVNLSASGGPPVSVSADMESDSAPIVLPTGTDSVRVVLTSTYTLSGYYTSGEAYASVSASALLDGVYHTILYDSDSWGFPCHEPNATYQVTFPASGGQSLAFDFLASAGAFGGQAQVNWQISSMIVTAFGPVALQRETWAGIKTFL
jgi:hypothetical protein